MSKQSSERKADLVIRGGQLIDGTGAVRVKADIACNGNRISAIGELHNIIGNREINADGNIISPGFIDVHTHDDRYLFTHPDMLPKTSQGVTTVVVGNCGFSLSPWKKFSNEQFPFSLWADRPDLCFETTADFFAALEKTPAATNVAVLIGHSSLRYGAMKNIQETANDREVKIMRKTLEESLAAGAIGMSSGLFYPPAEAATQHEVSEVAEALTDFDGIYTAHIRDESEHVLDAIEEAAAIARHADVQLIISHHKTAGLNNFGRTKETLPLIKTLGQNQNIHFDVYPYIASSTMVLPHMVTRSEKVLITWSKPHPECTARDLDEIAREWSVNREEAAKRLSPGGAIYFQLDEEDVRRVLKSPLAMVGSDGIPDDKHPHPRLWGSFAKVLGHYSRDVGLFSLEEAVYKMTGLPAQVFGFREVGTIRVGNYADFVVFDEKKIDEAATFEQPTKPAIGIECVIVSGKEIFTHGAPTGTRPGRTIKLSDMVRRKYQV